MTRFSAIGICSVGILSSSLIGCGDGETGVAKTSLAGEVGGGGAANGGASGSGNGGAAQGGSPAGGTTTSAGGVAVAGAGGAASGGVSGSTSVGGSAAGQGGAVTSGAGGATTGGNTSTGGATTAGNTSTGGATTAGNTSTGGATTAGNTGTAGAATGGVATGGAATGGVGTGGTTTVPVACTANFVLPANGETLTEADDVSGAYCANGFFYDVIVATDAPNGTTATLTVGNATPVAAIVDNAVARFPSAQMGTSGTQNLSIQVAASAGLTACTANESVTVNCLGHSTCAISKPTFPATHIALNGVAVAQGGDRVSSEGSPYEAAFEVTTDIEDGQPVALTVTNGTTPTTSYAVAMAGKATFPGVTFVPDGAYSATASCQARSGAKATSLALPVPVDTTGPDLVVTKGTGAGAATISALADGDHFGPSDDSDPTTGLQLKICGATAATDALGIDAGVFGSLADNFCVTTGGNTPVCAPALTSTSNGACVNFPCPGNGPFDLTVTLKDKAQNSRTTTAQNVTCAATNPVVQFLDPVSGGDGATPASFTDKSLRILAASATGVGQKKDKTAATLGAQYDVVVCTSAPAGSSATLRQGWYGDASLAQLAIATVAADTGNLCSGSQPSVVVFANVTLNESTVKADYTLDKATELSATITDLNFGSTTTSIDVWVDSVAPSLALISPANFCGSYINNSGTSTQSLTFGTAFGPVVAIVTPGSGSAITYTSATAPNFSQLVIAGVAFPQGTNQMVASVTKPSGNSGVFPTTGTCSVSVGSSPPPVVTWSASPVGSSPVATSLLTAPGNTIPGAVADGDTSTGGWQGTLRACVNITGPAAAGVTLQFSVNGTDVGTARAIDSTSGCATLPISGANEVPEGTSVQLSARTNVTPSGIGVGSINVPVDVTKPSTPTGLAAVTKVHRQTSFTLSWTLPAGGSPATDYDIRVSKSIIDDATKFNAAEVVAFNGTPQLPGVLDSVDVVGRLIETGYFFAIQATDDVGNRSNIVYTSTAKNERFYFTEILPPVANANNFGWAIDGSGDVNQDAYSDLIVGSATGTNVYIYFGSATGYATTPSVTIQGSAAYFGSSVSIVGDVNKDGILDIAIGSPREGGGAVYFYHGRQSWPVVLTSVGANSVVTVDTTADAKFANAQLGSSLARLGDFNSDGVDDVVIGVPRYNVQGTTYQGQVVIVYGTAGGIPASVSLPSAFGATATRIDGDATTMGRLGYWVVGSGYFYGSSLGTGLLASAAYTTTTAGANAGRLYSFAGKVGRNASIALSTARQTVDGTVVNVGVGASGISPLGDVGPGAQPAFGLPFLSATSSYVELRSGAAADGPFAQLSKVNTIESSANRVFARFVAGGGISGSSATMSLIGTSRSDVVISTQASGNYRLFIVDGARIAFPSNVNVETIADVVVSLPGPSTGTWQEMARQATLVRDADNDSYADIVVGDVGYGSTLPNGRVLVLR